MYFLEVRRLSLWLVHKVYTVEETLYNLVYLFITFPECILALFKDAVTKDPSQNTKNSHEETSVCAHLH